ncbi:MAG: GNAT family N-acetyltransferase [Ruminococcus sp.]|nr:GNAT family N-acetyltransferase [Ruminococcus sp.]
MAVTITDAVRGDLEEILRLQYLAYQSEAALCGTRDIPPLKQTLEEIRGEFESGLILKMVSEDAKIIGSVRAQEKGGVVYIGKLMVHPAHQRKGYGTRLLKAIEQRFPKRWYELFTSTKSVGNIRLYKSLGYNVFNEKGVGDGLRFVYLQKAVPQGNFDGGVVSFACGCCQSKAEMKTDTPPEFAGWAYSCERIEWLASGAPLPRLDERHFERLDKTPKISEKHRLRVCMAFRQALGSEFYMQYLAPGLYMSGDASDEIYRSCAIVRCRLDKVLTAHAYAAWVEVTVLDVIGYGEMHESFAPQYTDSTLEEFCGYPLKHAENYLEYDENGWKDFNWTMQGDVGTSFLIHTDEQGVRHHIVQQYFDFHDDIAYFGNIVSRDK